MVANLTKEDYFPYCTEVGADCSMINRQRIQQLVSQNKPLSKEEVKQSIAAHLLFLQSGGAGGYWKTIHIKGIVLALYFGEEVNKGRQASFELQQIPTGIALNNAVLPFSNFCSSKMEKVNFSEADLSYSILTDAFGKYANFSNARLAYTDFTRGNFQEADFQNANLIGADFENCNLTGANFKGANLRQARFPGAVLKDAIF